MKTSSHNYCLSCLEDFQQGQTVYSINKNKCVCEKCLPELEMETEKKIFVVLGERPEETEFPKEVKHGLCTSKYIGPKTAELSGVRIWRGDSHPNEIFIKVHDKPSSIHINKDSKRGNPHLFNQLDEILKELGI